MDGHDDMKISKDQFAYKATAPFDTNGWGTVRLFTGDKNSDNGAFLSPYIFGTFWVGILLVFDLDL